MTTYWVLLTSLFCYGFITETDGVDMNNFFSSSPKDPNLLIENMVRENGYPFELHHVTTKDGYILALHRIPSNDPNDNGQNQRQRVALVMHGLLGCSADWLINGKNQSIAFLLADNGYDVWLGNSRGTTTSKNHTTFSIYNTQFWDFSWHEMGIFDMPAMIDYILAETRQEQLFYVGFSQGTTQFWVLMSLLPRYNDKIKLMSALAPVAYVGHIGGILRLLSFFANFFRPLYNYVGYFEILSNSPLEKFISHLLCREGMITQSFCEILVSSIGGFSNGEVNHSRVANYWQFAPAGCSYKQLIHYAMGVQNPGHFRPYDYGMLRNLLKYKRFIPSDYPVEKITAPVTLYHGLNDVLAPPKDVELLNGKLPNILENYMVTEKPLAHFDFVYGLNIRELVYDRVIEKMNSIP